MIIYELAWQASSGKLPAFDVFAVAVESAEGAEVVREVMPGLVVAAEWLFRSGVNLTATEYAALSRPERVAAATAFERVQAARSLTLARALRGGLEEAGIVAALDEDAAEEMVLERIAP